MENTRLGSMQELGSLNGSLLNSKGMWSIEAGHKCGGIPRAEGRCCAAGHELCSPALPTHWAEHSSSTQDSVHVSVPNTSHYPVQFCSCLKDLDAGRWAGISLLLGGCPWKLLLPQRHSCVTGRTHLSKPDIPFPPPFPIFWGVFRGAEAPAEGNSPAVIVMVQCSSAAFRSATLIVTHMFGVPGVLQGSWVPQGSQQLPPGLLSLQRTI